MIFFYILSPLWLADSYIYISVSMFCSIIYDPMKSDNEERSAELFVQYTTECSVNLVNISVHRKGIHG